MDAARFKELQDDEQREESLDASMRAVVENELVDVHTCLPGVVKSFDAAAQTATVQPALRRFFVGRGYVNLPLCVNVPVQFPRYGNFIITGPVAAGDEGLLKFSERAIDNWWDAGGVQDPCEARMHDLSDSFFEPGYSSKGRVPSNISTDAFEIRTLDGATVLRIENGTIYIGAKAGSQRLPMFETYRGAEDTYLTAIVAGVQAALSALTLPAAAATLTAAQQAFNLAATTFLATKGKVV